ncbi:haloacid dehalogenase-like hydrolase [Gramella jeungdoensis]|uniref:Haloacid dehalogenase-like hydrolase n=1 Tax=Gramella jeungdoensis TaxID=708091 RepID=A0ABT0Z1Y4_9FLAO|nr:HAD family hydrolase [Gramella jeungdoensis]MCM8569719.1 haloacid dehalogenase-like hydrolase [Gramella jeungdoensis]
MKKIIVYDLNQTLYKKSSKDDFFKFICYKKDYKLIHSLQLAWMYALYSLKLINKTYFKENFYNYLKGIPPHKVEKYAKQFWDIEFPEYFREDMIRDIQTHSRNGIEVYIITGGFEIYTKYMEELLPVKVLGTLTKYENDNYRIKGVACNNEEKIRRLKEDVKGEYELLEAYSDDKEEILYHAQKGYYLDEKGDLHLVQKKEPAEN